MNRPNLQFTLREFTRTVSNGRLLLAFAIVVGLFALTGPFGTYDALDLPGRLGYWLITLATTWTIALLTISIFGAFRGQADHGNLILILTGSLLACVPITLAVELIGLAYFGRPLTASGFALQLLYTLPLSLSFGLLSYLAVRPVMTDAEEAPPARADRLIGRLPSEKRAPVLYMTMRDHYVEVVTSKGSELLLLRFSDALEELADAPGLQIHRSHWVATNAIAGYRKEKDRLLLQMSDGAELPVSRTHRKAVRELELEQTDLAEDA